MGTFATFLLTALKGKRQVWVLLIPETVTDEKQHAMSGQLCKSQSGTLAKITETWGRSCLNQKLQQVFGVFLFLFSWQLRGNVNQKDKRGN